VSLIEQDDIDRIDLSRYTTLILTGGSFRNLDAEEVKRWVRRGGHQVVFDNAIEWVRENGMLQLDRKPFDLDELVWGRSYAELDEARGAHYLGGAIFEARVDTTHPLAYGLPELLPVFLDRRVAYELSAAPGANVARFSAAPLLSG